MSRSAISWSSIGQSAYAAAKAGVIGLTVAAARDLSSTGIRVNTIAPGTMRTPSWSPSEKKPSPSSPPMFRSPNDSGYQLNSREVMRLDGGQRFAPK